VPSIDLARLRKQVARLVDFFFVPDEFTAHLNDALDSYVDYTVRKKPATAPGAVLRTYRTPAVVVRQIEQGLAPLATDTTNADATLDLADRLWDEGWLETCLLAAFLLGCIPPREERLLARLTAWTSQVRDPRLRASLLDSSLVRMRKQAPTMFLDLLREWLRPERARMWADGIQAAISAVSDPEFGNLPPLLDVIRPVVEAAPSVLQLDLEALIVALYTASPTETSYFIRQLLLETRNPMTAITFRRMSPNLPSELMEEIREFVRGKPISGSD
jgi:hypothetical protein